MSDTGNYSDNRLNPNFKMASANMEIDDENHEYSVANLHTQRGKVMKFNLEFQFLVILILCKNITRKCKRLQSPV